MARNESGGNLVTSIVKRWRIRRNRRQRSEIMGVIEGGIGSNRCYGGVVRRIISNGENQQQRRQQSAASAGVTCENQ